MSVEKRWAVENLDIKETLTIIRKRWLLIFVCTFFCTAGGVLYTASQKKLYRATAQIAVLPPRTHTIGEIKLETGEISTVRTYINTQKEILQSWTIMQKVLQLISDKECLVFFSVDKERIRAKDVLRVVQVERQRNSDIIKINCIGYDPEQCATIANLFVRVYKAETKEQAESSHNVLLDWLKSELPKLKKKVFQALEDMGDFARKHKEVTFVDRERNAYYNEVLKQLLKEKERIEFELEMQREQYEKCRASKEKNNWTAIQDMEFFEETPLLRKLVEKQFDLEQQLQEYRLKYTKKNDRMVILGKQWQAVNARIEKEIKVFVYQQKQKFNKLTREKKYLEKKLEKIREESLAANQNQFEYQRLTRDYQMQTQAYNSFLQKINEVDATYSHNVSNINFVDNAFAPIVPYKPRKLFNYLLSFAVGIMIGMAMAFFIEYFDDTVQSMEDIKNITQAVCVGTVPYITTKEFSKKSLAVKEKEHSHIAEAFRSIGTSLFFSGSQSSSHYVISSTSGSDGKTLVSCNLASTIAQTGYRVLLVDGDLRKPQLETRLALNPGPGFSEVLNGKISATDAVQEVCENYFCLTAGKLPKDPYQRIYNSDLKSILAQWEQDYQYVIIDSPPLTLTSDALLLSKATGSLLMVVAAGHCRRDVLRHQCDRLKGLQISINGIILNDKSGELANSQKYYGYYYGYNSE